MLGSVSLNIHTYIPTYHKTLILALLSSLYDDHFIIPAYHILYRILPPAPPQLNFNKKLPILLISMHLLCFTITKEVTIYTLLVCKIVGPKIRSCKILTNLISSIISPISIYDKIMISEHDSCSPQHVANGPARDFVPALVKEN